MKYVCTGSVCAVCVRCVCVCACFWVNEPQRMTPGSVGGRPISSAYCFLFTVHTQSASSQDMHLAHRQVDYSGPVLKKSIVHHDELSSCAED